MPDQTPVQDPLLQAETVLGMPGMAASILAAIDGQPDLRTARSNAARVLNDAKTHANAALEARFLTAPLDALPQIRAQSQLTDALVCAAFDVVRRLHPLPNPTASDRIAVLAVGGYGRAEMAPFSDVDLLLLFPHKIAPWAESLVESLLYILWDLKLKVGHSSRTVKDCIRLGREDITIRTALLEHRFVTGDPGLAADLDARLWSDLFLSTGRDFITAKLAERSERHRRQGGQRYVLEPNVKEAKGGLRDLQTLYWIGKYLHRVSSSQGLVGAGLLTAEEYGLFSRAENFLWAARCHMHYITHRATDQLTFDLQVEVAERMGYKDTEGRRAVEHFMQDYFRHATRVGELTRIFLTELEARHVKPEPRLAGFFSRRRVRPGYTLNQGRLDAADPVKFLATPLNLLSVFEEALRSGYLLHPNVMRLIASNLHLIDDHVRNDPEAVRVFQDLLLRHGNPERALRRMNELGVLSAFIPEFENIVAMMQFNVYHHYTVDEHIIQCVPILAQSERGELVEALPVATGILKTGVNRKVIYLALL
ncbi:MAG: [protein-PII] uridylyltransferase, partial [Candidatus Saccharibacteria bacterium]|nr:[protein-PII] uridylyltransferase [Pseudorhodobacter sp.]